MRDLEKAIELARKHEALYGIRNREECCVAACQEMAEWKEQQMIKKACEWMEKHVEAFMPPTNSFHDYNTGELIHFFQKSNESRRGMTNEEKALKMAEKYIDVCFDVENTVSTAPYRAAMEMAEWKDEQYVKVLTKLIVELDELKHQVKSLLP